MPKGEMARSNRKRGKRVQARIAKEMDAENVGGLGGEDCRHRIFSIEAKGLVRFVGQKFMQQAEKNCPDKKIPIVRIHLIGKPYTEDIILMRANQWANMHYKPRKGV